MSSDRSERVCTTRQRALELSGAPGAIEGPLRGYRHESYVFLLSDHGDGNETGGLRQFKCREPRHGALWFDRRCFLSEEQLLGALQGRVSRVPKLLEVGAMPLQQFIDGRTLGAVYGLGQPVPDGLLDQILRLFGELIAVAPGTVRAERRCRAEDRAEDRDCAGFLDGLIRFAEERVYEANLDEFGGLFAALGVDDESFGRLRKHVLVPGLTRRPFSLLHADLHRENFVLDPVGRLWTIDWELAMLRDPLYDLATHLHLMAYPAAQEDRVIEGWLAVAERSAPGSTDGWRDDLPRLRDFKRAQSVFTDVIRATQVLGDGRALNWGRWFAESVKVQRVLERAAVPLGLDEVPTLTAVARSLRDWHRRHRG
ncbi:phosphotransferase [Streptomyces nigra]|uniref:phosphotransferase n=1 Tax=Streptomyces nigra TaxID=1827580 RepID=UPI0036268CBD